MISITITLGKAENKLTGAEHGKVGNDGVHVLLGSDAHIFVSGSSTHLEFMDLFIDIGSSRGLQPFLYARAGPMIHVCLRERLVDKFHEITHAHMVFTSLKAHHVRFNKLYIAPWLYQPPQPLDNFCVFLWVELRQTVALMHEIILFMVFGCLWV